jgi:hypothetical protein
MINRTDKDSTDVKIGSIYSGHLGKGQTTTFYFIKEQKDAQVYVDGFISNVITARGIINIKCGYSYILTLYKLSDNEYRYTFNGQKISADNSSINIEDLR